MNNVIAIISSYNRGNKILPTIKSLLEQSKPIDKILIIDDGSQKLKKVPKIRDSRVEIIYLTDNVGVVWGRNLGLSRSANYKYALLIDDDIELEKHALKKMLLAFNSKPDCVASMPVVYFKDKPEEVWSSGSGIDLTTGRTVFYTKKPKSKYFVIPAATSVLLADMGVIKKAGWYDPVYFFCYEDIDFYYRLQKYGKFYCVSGASAYHDILYGDKSLERVAFRSYHIARGRVIFLSKYSKYYPFNLGIVFIFLIYYQYLGFKYNIYASGLNFVRGFIDGIRVVLKKASLLNDDIKFQSNLSLNVLKDPSYLKKYKVRI